MKRILTLIIALGSFISYSQTIFEPGYIIFTNKGTTEVLIRNYDWRNNPSSVEYKTAPDTAVQTATLEEIQEFGVGDQFRYKKFTTAIDQSSDNSWNLSRDRNPEYKDETVLLQVLVDGEVDLYQFRDNEKNRFFFALGEEEVQQLVYKQYEYDKFKRRGNNLFRQQLLNSLTCDKIEMAAIAELPYSKDQLVKFIKVYNECLGSDYKEYLERNKGSFHLRAKAGILYTSLRFEESGTLASRETSVQMDPDMGLSVGLEAEYRLPFNNSKWAVFVNPSFQQARGKKSYFYRSTDSEEMTILETDLKMLSVPVGIRHYFYLNTNSAIYANAAFEINKYFNSSITDSEQIYFDEIEIADFTSNLQFGLGYSYKNRLGLEVRASLPQDILRNYVYLTGETTYMGLLLTYTFI